MVILRLCRTLCFVSTPVVRIEGKPVKENQRTPKKRERPTRLLGPRPKTNPKQLVASLTSKAQSQTNAEQQTDPQKQQLEFAAFLSVH